ncbi:MAG: hypothetical protein Q8903_14940 [Bacteroidota bacterium]|nr:hypothetical protein [Bacteroidota bacterium]
MRKVVMLLFVVLILSGCSKDAGVKQTIEESFNALKSENVDKYLATIDEDSPMYKTNKQIAPFIFSAYDLDYKVENIKIISNENDKAVVEVTVAVKKIKGPRFDDTRSISSNILVKKQGKWKIQSTSTIKTERI